MTCTSRAELMLSLRSALTHSLNVSIALAVVMQTVR
jgi:hypothetical protein